jgi:hypothetical protein
MKSALTSVLLLALLTGALHAGEVDSTQKTREGVRKRLVTDFRDLQKTISAADISKHEREELLAEIAALNESFDPAQTSHGDDFRAILPLNDVHARLFRVQAALWRLQGHEPLTVWNADLWGNLELWELPPSKDTATVRLHMMRNEYRAGAFNISNASSDVMTLRLRIEVIPGGRNPGYITVHQVEWTDTRTGRVVAAALPEAAREGDSYVIDVLPGLTRQVWFTFHPVDVPAGVLEGRIEVRTGDVQVDVPLTLTVYPFHFPDQPALHSGGWDYTSKAGTYGVTEENLEAFLAHCREHFVDSPWASNRVLSPGKHDAQGNMIAEPDTTAFDTWVKRWESARQFCVYAAVGNTFVGYATGTPEFETAVKAFATFWANHMKELGLKPGQLIWLLRDEPRNIDTDKLIIAWAKAIRAANTGIQIWEDPIYSDMSDAHPELAAACHILCPNRTMFLRAPEQYGRYFLEQRDKGVTLEFYSCRGPARLLDPYAYYRMQAWSCWQYHAIATNFWAWGDNAGVSSWNEYLAPRTAYTPFFIDATSITAGKHMEAVREGIEDYEYLLMLKQALASAEKEKRHHETVRQVRDLLTEIPGRVLNPATLDAFWWRDPLDRTVADKARLDILNALAALGQ